MIKEVTMYTVICDNCGTDCNARTDYSCWADKSTAKELASYSDWIEHENKDYCPYCISVGDNDEVKIDTSRTKQHGK